MLEAMASGCLLIASRTAPVEEVIREGENGVMVDFFRPEEIAARALEAIESPTRFMRLRECASTETNYSFNYDREGSIYKSFIQDKG